MSFALRKMADIYAAGFFRAEGVRRSNKNIFTKPSLRAQGKALPCGRKLRRKSGKRSFFPAARFGRFRRAFALGGF